VYLYAQNPIGIFYLYGGATMDKPQEIWQKKKSNLLDSINETMEKGSVDKEVLQIMKELLENAKVNNSIGEYFDNLEQEE